MAFKKVRTKQGVPEAQIKFQETHMNKDTKLKCFICGEATTRLPTCWCCSPSKYH